MKKENRERIVVEIVVVIVAERYAMSKNVNGKIDAGGYSN